MNLSLAVPVYLTLWWLVFLCILPLGVVSHAEAGIDLGDGGDPGAPVDPKMRRKLITTTWVSAVLTGVVWLVLGLHLVPVELLRTLA